ncbi:replication-associated recombination protein A [bacterium BMS3Bbin11]|nr:replication-associated recombination protein A [bacterium BMS3Abin11]GBE45038.1 replication-associated recombination protein A [bacterium BMS3Bbin11]GMT41423.1 MAG: ATPase AAA [bacterium]HDH15260.1 replication-associated recombination protein A [Gammaproteobacteria bacterium]HDZ78771.1 replication-associated recombination protein A [Gammaproteobacteria bacterium]
MHTISLHAPLADRMRPQEISECAGQQHLLKEGKPIRHMVESQHAHSMILWGPPGTGKTTLARLIAHHSSARLLTMSAVHAGVKDIRAVVEQARQNQEIGEKTLLFVDEVHRFNKTQQDGFLPHIEDGTFDFIGATTENPSFELNNALLSRLRVYVLKSLTEDDIIEVLQRAITDRQRGLGDLFISITDEALRLLAGLADGDARRSLNMLEIAVDFARTVDGRQLIDKEAIKQVAGDNLRRFDKGGDAFYDQISALHKSVRGSSPDAALYWLARMLDGGADPFYVARRVVRMASEDIGNADPRGLQLALNAWEALERLGSPEGELALAQAVSYLASVPKSNAVYMAWKKVLSDVRKQGSQPVPMHLRNAPTKLMKELGASQNYRYAHDEEEGYASGENYFPEGMKPVSYYEPLDRGLEKKIAEHLRYLGELDQAYRQQKK